MLHSLILGASYSGKTTLAKILCQRMKARGLRTAVLDPMRDADWSADRQYHDADEFLRFVRTGTVRSADERWALFIDESHIALDHHKRFDPLATTGRHMGCVSYFICFNLKQLTPAIRGQCMRRFIFRITKENARDLADEYDADELLGATKLAQGEFFLIEPNKPIRRGRVIKTGRRCRVEMK
jgi:hypothetical protein